MRTDYASGSLANFYPYLFKYSGFQDAVQRIYAEHSEFLDYVTTDGGMIDSLSAQYAEVYSRNFTDGGWDITASYIDVMKNPLPTHAENVGYFKEWLTARKAWMNTYVSKFVPHVWVESVEASEIDITLNWKAEANADKYAVYRKIEGSSWTKIATVVNKTKYVDKTAQQNVQYYYDVIAIKNGVYGAIDANGIASKLLEKVAEGIIEEDGSLYYYENGIRTFAGLIDINGDYYYANEEGMILTGEVYVSKTNDIVEEGTYFFNESGKLVLNGVCRVYGELGYYVDGAKVYKAGLVYVDGYYYYVTTPGVVVTGQYYVNKNNGLMPSGKYNFDENGRMILPKNGIVKEDGVMYYYVNNKKAYVGLIKIDGYYYYVNSKCEVITGRRYITRTNDLLPAGWYVFDEEGRMIESKNGIVKEDGVMYYYVNNKKAYVGLIELNGYYYYVNSKCEVVTGRRYITRTNDLMKAGWYNFDEEGRMIIPVSGENN